MRNTTRIGLKAKVESILGFVIQFTKMVQLFNFIKIIFAQNVLFFDYIWLGHTNEGGLT